MMLKKIFRFGLVIFAGWVAGASFNLFLNKETDWVKSIYLQKIAFAQQCSSPNRLLVLGGSSTLYGISAEQMQKKLGISTYNLGLHAGLGLDVILSLGEREVRVGDIVLLMPEQPLLHSRGGIGSIAPGFGLELGNPAIGEHKVDKIIQKWLLAGSPSLQIMLRDVRMGEIQTPLLSQGDVTNFPQARSAKPIKPPSSVSDYTLQQLRDFQKFVEQQGAFLILGLPWMYSDRDEIAIRNGKSIVQSLSQVAPVLYNRKTFNLISDGNLFTDTGLHLSEEGRKKRTRELIRQIRSYVESEDF